MRRYDVRREHVGVESEHAGEAVLVKGEGGGGAERTQARVLAQALLTGLATELLEAGEVEVLGLADEM